MKKKFIFIFSIIISCIFSSCGPKLFFSEAKEIDSKGWAKDSLLRFNVEVTDTVSEYSFLISVRNTDEYPAQNLWLFMDIIDPSGKVEKDTVECYLANNKGEWVGSGFGSLNEVNVLCSTKMTFPLSGKYEFVLQQGMRYDVLPGINDVGIELYYAEKD